MGFWQRLLAGEPLEAYNPERLLPELLASYQEEVRLAQQLRAHADHAPHRHVHIVAVVGGRLQAQDFQLLRKTATEACLEQRRELDLARAQKARMIGEEAIPHLRRAEELKPDHELAPYLLGLAYRQQKQLGEAETAPGQKKCRSEPGNGGIPALSGIPASAGCYCSSRQATRGELTAVPRKGQLQPLQTRTGEGARRSPFPRSR